MLDGLDVGVEVGEDDGEGDVSLVVIVNVCVLLQPLVSPSKTHGNMSNWSVVLGL
jgi:hypothetical protein